MQMIRFDPPTMLLIFDPASDPERPWRAARNHKLTSAAFRIEVAEGFACDLASVPDWLAVLFPPNGAHQRAAFFHDAMYALQVTDRRTADAVFRSILRQDGVPRWRRVLMYAAVRLLGRRTWGKNTKDRLSYVSGGKCLRC